MKADDLIKINEKNITSLKKTYIAEETHLIQD